LHPKTPEPPDTETPGDPNNGHANVGLHQRNDFTLQMPHLPVIYNNKTAAKKQLTRGKKIIKKK